MARYRLTLAYDGTDFCGWQKQEPAAPGDSGNEPARGAGVCSTDEPIPESPRAAKAGGPDYRGVPRIESQREGRIALRTVQGVVERAVREVVREPVELIGASRTDSGVHARGQVAAFTCAGGGGSEEGRGALGTGPRALEDTEGVEGSGRGGDEGDPSGWPVSRGVERLARAINGRLPDDVLVLSAEVADSGFDPVFGALRKAYSYTLHVSRDRPLWNRRYVHHVWVPLDVASMREAARLIEGEHDFAGFAAAGHGRQTTVRTVHSCVVREVEGDAAACRGVVRIDVEGSGFLWNMVRIIAGTLTDVGRSRLTPDDVRAALQTGDRRRAGPTFPPEGLCLEWIKYGDSP